jgi:sec-independent protein translocase protein TatA
LAADRALAGGRADAYYRPEQVPGVPMGGFSIWHLLIVLVVVVLVFGAGRLPRLMGDLGSGVKAFKRGLSDTPVDAKDSPPAKHG